MLFGWIPINLQIAKHNDRIHAADFALFVKDFGIVPALVSAADAVKICLFLHVGVCVSVIDVLYHACVPALTFFFFPLPAVSLFIILYVYIFRVAVSSLHKDNESMDYASFLEALARCAVLAFSLAVDHSTLPSAEAKVWNVNCL